MPKTGSVVKRAQLIGNLMLKKQQYQLLFATAVTPEYRPQNPKTPYVRPFDMTPQLQKRYYDFIINDPDFKVQKDTVDIVIRDVEHKSAKDPRLHISIIERDAKGNDLGVSHIPITTPLPEFMQPISQPGSSTSLSQHLGSSQQGPSMTTSQRFGVTPVGRVAPNANPLAYPPSAGQTTGDSVAGKDKSKDKGKGKDKGKDKGKGFGGSFK